MKAHATSYISFPFDNNRTANNDAEGTDRDMESETTITDYYNDDA